MLYSSHFTSVDTEVCTVWEFIQGFERSWCQEKDVSQAFGLGLESHHLLAKIMGCPLCWSKRKDNAFIVLSFHSGLSHGWAYFLRKVLCLRRISVHPSKGVRLGLLCGPGVQTEASVSLVLLRKGSLFLPK